MSAFKLQVNLNGSWRDVVPIALPEEPIISRVLDAATVLVQASGKPMRLVKERGQVVSVCPPPQGEWKRPRQYDRYGFPEDAKVGGEPHPGPDGGAQP